MLLELLKNILTPESLADLLKATLQSYFNIDGARARFIGLFPTTKESRGPRSTVPRAMGSIWAELDVALDDAAANVGAESGEIGIGAK